jgi:hypothetical protein
MTNKNNNVNDEIKVIKSYYKLGMRIRAESKGKPKRGMIANLASEYQIHSELARKLRVLADKEKGFTRAELAEQFAYFKKTGKTLSISHLIRSLALGSKEMRTQALKEACDNDLSSHAFQAYITAMQPNLRGAGRKPKAPTVPDFDQLVGSLVSGWKRKLDAYMEKNEISNKEIRRTVRELLELMEKVITLAIPNQDVLTEVRKAR